jgi:hypothetical protein
MVMNRRRFIGAALGSLAAPAFAQDALFDRARTAARGVVDIGSRKQLFLDDLLIAERSRISKLPKHPEKHATNPILVADQPWERFGYDRAGEIEVVRQEGVEITGQCVLYDEDEKIFKMWYVPYAWQTGLIPLCYAFSHDGFRWEKPQLGLYEFEGSKKNNILRAADERTSAGYFNVVKDPNDPDPRRRYKAMGETEGAQGANTYGGVAVAFSPDGLTWTEHPGNPVVKHGPNLGDAPTMMGWDPRISKYLGFFRPGHPIAREIDGIGKHRHIRTIGYSTSEDFIHWTPTEIMLAPDEGDRVDAQYMQFTAAWYEGFYVGLLMIHHTHEQTWDTYLLSSRDGFRWNWIDRPTPFLGRGPAGSYDAGYQTPSGPIVHDGRIWIYYGAFSGAHSFVRNRLGTNRMTVAVATLPQDRYVGLLAGPDRGILGTRPVTFTGSRLLVDLDASLPDSKTSDGRGFDECEVRASLLDQSGGPLEGFTLERSKRVTEGGIQEISWQGADLQKLAGKPVRIRLEMRNAALYSIQFI